MTMVKNVTSLNQLLEMKWVFKHQDLQVIGLRLNKYE